MAVEDTSESENERKCFGVYIFSIRAVFVSSQLVL